MSDLRYEVPVGPSLYADDLNKIIQTTHADAAMDGMVERDQFECLACGEMVPEDEADLLPLGGGMSDWVCHRCQGDQRYDLEPGDGDE